MKTAADNQRMHIADNLRLIDNEETHPGGTE